MKIKTKYTEEIKKAFLELNPEEVNYFMDSYLLDSVCAKKKIVFKLRCVTLQNIEMVHSPLYWQLSFNKKPRKILSLLLKYLKLKNFI